MENLKEIIDEYKELIKRKERLEYEFESWLSSLSNKISNINIKLEVKPYESFSDFYNERINKLKKEYGKIRGYIGEISKKYMEIVKQYFKPEEDPIEQLKDLELISAGIKKSDTSEFWNLYNEFLNKIYLKSDKELKEKFGESKIKKTIEEIISRIPLEKLKQELDEKLYSELNKLEVEYLALMEDPKYFFPIKNIREMKRDVKTIDKVKKNINKL